MSRRADGTRRGDSSQRGVSLRVRWAVITALLVTGTGVVAVAMTTITTERLLTTRSRELLGPPTGGGPIVGSVPPRAPGLGGEPVPGATPAGKAVADAVIHDVRVWGAILVGALALCSVAIAWLLSKRMLRPLRNVIDVAHNVASAGDGTRIALGGPRDELRELADTIDKMLDRLDASSTAQRNFVADASHELRTPLAAMAVEIDVALDYEGANRDDLREALAGVRGSLRRSQRLVESLLVLASAGTLTNGSQVDLAATASRAMESAHALNPEVTFAGEREPASIHGDAILIERGIANLIENAIRYGTPGAPIRVDVNSGESECIVCVNSDGPVVSADEAEAWFGRFQRGDRSRATSGGGAGLGLAIVRQIADAHGATVNAVPMLAGGVEMQIRFPRRA